MLLITEVNEDVQLVCEEKDGKKNYSIEGIFMQSEKVNRNGRRYQERLSLVRPIATPTSMSRVIVPLVNLVTPMDPP